MKKKRSASSRGHSKDRSTRPMGSDKQAYAMQRAKTAAFTQQANHSNYSFRTASSKQPSRSSTANKLFIMVSKPKKSNKRIHRLSKIASVKKAKPSRFANASSKKRSAVGTLKVRAFNRRGRKQYICIGIVPIHMLKKLSARHKPKLCGSKHASHEQTIKRSSSAKKNRGVHCKHHKPCTEHRAKKKCCRPRAPSKSYMRSQHEHSHACSCVPHCPPPPPPECSCVNHIKVISKTETLFDEQQFTEISLRGEQVMPAQDTSKATVYTYAVINRGANDMLAVLEISPNGKDYVRDATERIHAGETAVIVPNRFLKWTRIRIIPEGATTADIYYQCQSIGTAKGDR